MADTRPMTNTGLHRISRMLGLKIENPVGEPLGALVDVVIDLGESHVVAAVLSVTDPVDQKALLVAIPLSALGYEPVAEKLVLNVDLKTLREAPAFRREEWSELIDRSWAADLYSHYGCDPYWH